MRWRIKSYPLGVPDCRIDWFIEKKRTQFSDARSGADKQRKLTIGEDLAEPKIIFSHTLVQQTGNSAGTSQNSQRSATGWLWEYGKGGKGVCIEKEYGKGVWKTPDQWKEIMRAELMEIIIQIENNQRKNFS